MEGDQIVHPELAEALRRKTAFTLEELDAFNLPDLGKNSYIQTGEPNNKYKPLKIFKPLEPPVFLKG